MNRLTLATARPAIARVFPQCSSSSALTDIINEAQSRLLNRSFAPSGTRGRYRVCLGSSACLTWPRQVRTVEAWWRCNQPGLVFNGWYETIGWGAGGIGLADPAQGNGSSLIDQGTACSFDNVLATAAAPRRIQAVASNPADNGKKITLRYIDGNGNRVYTSIGGVVQEGEQLTLSTAGVLTASNVAQNGLYHVVKETTAYPVRLYSYNQATAAQTALLAVYEPSETVPIYRRSLIPGLTEAEACPDAAEGCATSQTITILARLQHVPVVVDNDPLIIGSIAALKEMVQSILLAERFEIAQAEAYEARALRELDGELAGDEGDGAFITPRAPPLTTWGGGGIINLN